MSGKQVSTPAVDAAVGRAVNYELSIADLARRSERRAWMVAFAAVTMAVLLAAGCFALLPLKEKVPFLVMADAHTGNAAVARVDSDFGQRWVTASEAVNRSHVARFVTMREAFDDALMQLRDWRAVHSMSSPQVAAAFSALHSPRNPDRPFSIYGRGKAVRVRILSIVFMGGGVDTPPEGATVRFQRSVYDKGSGVTEPLDSKIATLGFTYKPGLKMDEQDRIENPLGFQVTSYRVDSDYAAMPPLERPRGHPEALVPTEDPNGVPVVEEADVAGDANPAVTTTGEQGAAE
ncbi:MAG: conjugative transfer protein [Lysobacterales bacterium RIFOXYD1_FULL_69_11]|nr:MAG: conjugative transfer protein [Xanthomonadales bacterium RIFOXYA1_FULL_69_10]OHE87509.1 MAG: conjugative transfer protein [Xanthomonadales bacterium RIFOXYD1_FULL_69_11]